MSGEKNSYVMVDSFGLPSVLTPKEWENTLFQALNVAVLNAKRESSQTWLQRRILSVIEEEKLLDEKMRMPEEELPQIDNIDSLDEISDDNYGEYISHRLRSVIEGSQIGRVCEVIYWSVAANSSQASTLAMFGLVDAKRNHTRKHTALFDTWRSSCSQTIAGTLFGCSGWIPISA